MTEYLCQRQVSAGRSPGGATPPSTPAPSHAVSAPHTCTVMPDCNTMNLHFDHLLRDLFIRSHFYKASVQATPALLIDYQLYVISNRVENLLNILQRLEEVDVRLYLMISCSAMSGIIICFKKIMLLK